MTDAFVLGTESGLAGFGKAPVNFPVSGCCGEQKISKVGISDNTTSPHSSTGGILNLLSKYDTNALPMDLALLTLLT